MGELGSRVKANFNNTNAVLDAWPSMFGPEAIIGQGGSVTGMVDAWELARGIAAGFVTSKNVIALTGAATIEFAGAALATNGALESGVLVGSIIDAAVSTCK
jgi:hypothetical protein